MCKNALICPRFPFVVDQSHLFISIDILFLLLLSLNVCSPLHISLKDFFSKTLINQIDTSSIFFYQIGTSSTFVCLTYYMLQAYNNSP